MGYVCKVCGRMFMLVGFEAKVFFSESDGNVVFCPYCREPYLSLDSLMKLHRVK